MKIDVAARRGTGRWLFAAGLVAAAICGSGVALIAFDLLPQVD
jgi:hypothetical protein